MKKHLLKFIKKHGMSYRDLSKFLSAKGLNVSPAFICYLVSGKRGMSIKNMKKLSKIMKVDISELIN